MFKINMEKAKEIHKENIRLARQPILEKLDIDFMRSVERGDKNTQKSIAEQKQKLRDATQNPDIDVAINLTELKKSWDSELLGKSPYSLNYNK